MTTQMVEVTKTVRGEVIAVERRALTVWCCGGCGVLYAVDTEYIDERRRDGKTFYCPNGCARSYSETEATRLKRQLEARQRDLDGALERMAMLERSRAAVQGALTKAQRRAHAGVCPECHRTFQQVARHMASKHPAVTS